MERLFVITFTVAIAVLCNFPAFGQSSQPLNGASSVPQKNPFETLKQNYLEKQDDQNTKLEKSRLPAPQDGVPAIPVTRSDKESAYVVNQMRFDELRSRLNPEGSQGLTQSERAAKEDQYRKQFATQESNQQRSNEGWAELRKKLDTQEGLTRGRLAP